MHDQRILVTPRSLTEGPHPEIEKLKQRGIAVVFSSPGKQPDEAELISLVPEITGWLAGVEPVSPAVIKAAPRLKVISRNGTGIDNLPMAFLQQRGIDVRKADGANAQGVAELAIAMMFAALRHIPLTDNGLKHGEWPRKRGLEMRGRCLGVIGCGAVGGQVARLAAALGVNVLGFDPARPETGIDPARFQWASREEIYRKADMISLHCPPAPGGMPLINADVFEIFNKGMILVNTARPGLVDETALVDALEKGIVSTYCTDVFDTEPPAHPGLACRSDVIATSHIGGYTAESVNRATEMAIANLLDSLGINNE